MKKYSINNDNKIDIYDERWYKFDNDFYPSVTFILNTVSPEGLNYWFKQVGMNADLILKEAQIIGSEFHRLAEKYIISDSVNFNDIEIANKLAIWLRIKNFHNFYKKHLSGHNIIAVEEKVFNENYKYAGTIDLITEFEGVTYIWDWKTGKMVYKDNKAQISAYAKSFPDKEIEARIVVFPVNPNKQGYTITKLDKSKIDYFFQYFLWVKIEFDNTHKKPMFKSLPTKFKKG